MCKRLRARFRIPSTLAVAGRLFLTLLVSFVASRTSSAQELVWDNREPAGFRSVAFDVDVQGRTVVASGEACNEQNICGLLVRAYDRTSGRILWEDQLFDFEWNRANEVSVEAQRVFVAGWSLRPQPSGFQFIVRAYDLNTGELLWYREIDRSNRDVAKVLAVHGGRVFVAGHIWNTAQAHSDYALLAFDARTGETLWEHISDYLDLRQTDAAWSVVAAGDRILVSGEARLGSSIIVRAHSAANGTILWEDEIPNAANFAEEHCIGVHGKLLFVCGSFFGADFTDDAFVRAYDVRSGQVRWTDRVDDGGRLSQATALTVAGGRVFVAAYLGCNPTTFVECRLALRAYDPATGALLWSQVNESPGNDWFVNAVAASGREVFVSGEQLNAAGHYEPTILAYDAAGGTPIWAESLDVGAAPIFASGIYRLVIYGNHLLAGGVIWSGTGRGSNILVREYRIHP